MTKGETGFLYPFRLISPIWVEISNRRHRVSLPFRLISLIWVEISERRHRVSLPFSTDFRYLGRDFRPAALGFSTFSTGFPDLGRDFQPAATGILYPFRLVSPIWVEISRPAALGFSTLFG